MALSGSFTGTTNNGAVTPKIDWSGVQSVSGNYTDVTATLSYSRNFDPDYMTYGTWNGSITINGTKISGSKYVEITYNSNTVTLSATARVYHNSDGTKSITISASGAISGTSVAITTISATVTLTTISKATTPTFSGSKVMGEELTINLPRTSSSFTHVVTYSFGNTKGRIADAATTSAIWILPVSLALEIPNATSGTCTIGVGTWDGDTLIGTKEVTITLTVPSSVVPIINNVSITEATAGLAAKFGAFVQNKSTLSVAITAYGAYGSTISAYQTSIQSVPYKGASFTSGVITASGTISVVTTVTDSRGRTAQISKSVTVLEYSPPQITSLTAYRINTSGSADNSGERIAVAVKYAIATVNSKNTRLYSVRYKISGATSFSAVAENQAASVNYDGTLKYTSSPTISGDNAWVIRFELTDYFTTVAVEVEIPTAFTVMDFRSTGKGVAIGKVSEKDAFEVAMDTEFTGETSITAKDSELLKLYRSDGKLCAFLKVTDGGNGLALQLYTDGSASDVVKFTKYGAVSARNIAYGTAVMG